MVRICVFGMATGVGFALGLGLAPMARGAEQAAGTALPPAVQAKFQQTAVQTCNNDLEHDRFEGYATMDDCVADKMNKLIRTYHENPAAAQSASAAPKAQRR